jgi:ubiquinone/menaquinone biosynthesis C-methylase UbiE
MNANISSWQNADVARRFLDIRRSAIPYAGDQIEIMLHLVRHFVGEPKRVLDLGCGDGILARAVLTVFSNASAMLIDHSPPMLERARQAMAPFRDRFVIVPGELGEPLDRVVTSSFDLVVSGFAIHHLPTERKRALYAEIFGFLEPGGLFVQIEHVASATPCGEKLFDKLYVDSLAAHNGRPREQVEAEYLTRPDRADNKLESVERQLEWLREIGYGEVDCFFKWMELTVFAGQRVK